jgi:hypothetical protein
MQRIKKYLSLFFLLLFLFPMAEKGWHAFEHQADEHCEATDKHFHKQGHSCSLCDFTITDSNYPAEKEYSLIITVQPFLFRSPAESVNTPSAFQSLPARAPPVV